MNIEIRQEKQTDYTTVEKITREAFWNVYEEGASEHYIVHTMRSHPDFISELSFVITVDNKIVGSIFYTRSRIISDKGIEAVLTFGPVSINPKYQNKELGSKLIHHSIKLASKLDYTAIVITGDLKFYERFGFKPAKTFGISMNNGEFHSGLLALAFDKKHVPQAGKIYFSEVYEIDELAKVALEKFDMACLKN